MIVKNLEKKEKSTVTFDVICDADEFEAAINTVYRKNKNKIFVQGFRKGKAPRMIIEGMYGKDVFYDDATDELAPKAFQFAVEQEKLRVVGNPAVSKVDIADSKEITLSFMTAVRPEVTLGQYKGLEAPMAKVEITEERVDEELTKIQHRNARIVSVERPAKEGDTAVIDYTGTIDGEPFEGGSDEGHGLILGSGTFIPGFEDQVVGMNIGEEKDVNVTFPEDYHAADLAGKAAVFHVKVNDIKEEQMPELDDEFAKDVSECDTLAEYRESVRARLESSEKANAEADYQSRLIEIAGDNITADIPDAMIEEQIDSMVREYDQNLSVNGLSLDMYLKYLGQDVKAFRETCRATAERRVKTDLLLEAVAEAEGIEATEQEIAEEYQKVADQYDMELDAVKSGVPESAIIGDLKSRRAAQIIFDSGVPTEPVEEEKTEEAPAEEKPVKKARKTKKADAEANEEAASEEKPAKKTRAKKADAEENTESAEASEEPAKPAKKTRKTEKKAEESEGEPSAE